MFMALRPNIKMSILINAFYRFSLILIKISIIFLQQSIQEEPGPSIQRDFGNLGTSGTSLQCMQTNVHVYAYKVHSVHELKSRDHPAAEGQHSGSNSSAGARHGKSHPGNAVERASAYEDDSGDPLR